MVPSACKLFTGIDDPRVVSRTTHSLAEILFAALCATLCGFGCCDGYAQFARAKVDFLRRYLPYQDGTPSHDTFGRLFRLIKPEQFETVLADLAQRVTAGSAGQVAIDGKTVRGSADVRRGIPPLHLLHAFATDVGLCIGQVAVDGKSNEITALPELLGLLDLSVIEDHPKRARDLTMDALHTQRTSAKLLHEAGAHYVMALKGNQATLLQDVETFLGDPLAPVLEHEDTDAGHGRIETRRARVCTDIAWLSAHQWPGLAAIGRVDRTRICKRTGATTTESQLYLLGHAYTPERLLALSRGHWTVENNLHWVLDVTMSEDASLVRRDHGPRNHARLKRPRSSAWRSTPSASSRAKTPSATPCEMQCWTCGFSPTSSTICLSLDAKALLACGNEQGQQCHSKCADQ